MDHLNKDSPTNNGEANKEHKEQPKSSSKSVLPDTSGKIRTSAWITLAILDIPFITFYGETMLLPAIRDIIGDFSIFHTIFFLDTYRISYLRCRYDPHLLESYLISMDERKWF